jgi:NADPH:quinone reductase-like Zn-dependent oxidoreductase
MRAYRHTSFTGIGAVDLEDEDIPGTGAGQVLVRVHASSVNFRDPVIATGQGSKMPC